MPDSERRRPFEGVRRIIHVDMDAFYASVEQRDDASLRGFPVAVGGSSRRGVVMAASYEARAFGVHSALPSAVAARRCPNLVFVKARFDVYRTVSQQIRAIFHRYSDLVEPLSLDEAYLDVTHPLAGPPSATLIAQQIRAEIQAETGLTASAGVSFNKFLAKVASAANKPDGLTVITPEDAPAFIDALPIERFFGVGPVTARRMRDAGIHRGADLKQWTEEALLDRFGKSGRYFYRAAHGLDARQVRSHRVRKSLGAERTFFDDTDDADILIERLDPICQEVARRLAKARLAGRTVTLKIKHFDFTITTRQNTFPEALHTEADLARVARRLLLHTPGPPEKRVRLLGVTLSKLRSLDGADQPEQLRLELG